MRWVNETFPPRLRCRKLLITIRLSASSFAGTARTDVAVGTSSEAVMFLTTAAAMPRSGVTVSACSSTARSLSAFSLRARSSGVAVVAGLLTGRSGAGAADPGAAAGGSPHCGVTFGRAARFGGGGGGGGGACRRAGVSTRVAAADELPLAELPLAELPLPAAAAPLPGFWELPATPLAEPAALTVVAPSGPFVSAGSLVPSPNSAK